MKSIVGSSGTTARISGWSPQTVADTPLKSAHVFNSRIYENTYLIDGDNYLTSLRDQLKAWVKSECRRCELPWRNSCDKDLLKSDRFTIDCRWVQAVLITDLATSRFDSPPAVRPAIQCADTCIDIIHRSEKKYGMQGYTHKNEEFILKNLFCIADKDTSYESYPLDSSNVVIIHPA